MADNTSVTSIPTNEANSPPILTTIPPTMPKIQPMPEMSAEILRNLEGEAERRKAEGANQKPAEASKQVSSCCWK